MPNTSYFSHPLSGIMPYHTMSIEAPVRVDLAQDNPWEATNLTDEEKNYLREQFTAERNEVLYLTQQELSELSRIVETQRNSWISSSVRDAMGWELETFIEEQNGLSLSDLLGEQNEQFSAVEEIAEQLLFSENWAMKNLNLSDRPKQYLSTALALSIIEQIHQHENPVSVLNDPQLIITDMWSWLEDLLFLSRLTNNHWDWSVLLQDNWEWNEICMNVLRGREFFNQLLNWELPQEEIRETLYTANTNEAIEAIDISELSSEVQDIIADIHSRISTTQDEWDNSDIWSDADDLMRRIDESETAEERKTLLDLLADLIKALGDALKGMLDGAATTISRNSDWNTDTVAAWAEQWEVLSPELLTQISELSSTQIGGIDTRRLRGSLDNSETQIQIRQILEWLIPEKNLEQTIEHLFSGEETRFSQFTTQLRNNQFPALIHTEWSVTPISQFRAILEEYGAYRASEGVAWVSEGRTSWADYAASRREANWESSDS